MSLSSISVPASERESTQVRRVIFYLFHDRDGLVDDYVTYKLSALRPFADHIFVVSHSELDEVNHARLSSVADTVWTRENSGYDVAAFQGAFEQFGTDRLSEYDELILMNSTFFAPIFPFAELFGRMDALDVDFWGISAHKLVDPNPFANTTGVLHRHIQTHWVAVRRAMFTSLEWSSFWNTMPPLVTYDDVVLNYEARFTHYFEQAGYSWLAAWSDEDYPTDHAIFESAPLLLADRCPILKRRQFFHDPMFLERSAIIGRRVLQMLEQSDYPVDLIWQNVARTAEPRNLYTNFSLLEVLPDRDRDEPLVTQPTVTVVAHLVHPSMVDGVMQAIARIPVHHETFVTTTRECLGSVQQALSRHEITPLETRIVEEGPGRHIQALLVDSADQLRSVDTDLVCRVHTFPPPTPESFNGDSILRDHVLDNTLSSPGYINEVLRLFGDHRSLGMVFPPVVNISHPLLGHGWRGHRGVAHTVANETGIRTVFDATTPVAPYGGMFWVRPRALAKLVEHGWTADDYTSERYAGKLAGAQERLLAYAVLDAGYHIRSVTNIDWASINYTFLEYKLARLSSMMPAQTQEQLEFVRQAQAHSSVALALKREIDHRSPRFGSRARSGFHRMRTAADKVRALRG